MRHRLTDFFNLCSQLGFNKVSNADQLRETFRSIYKSDEENAFLADYGTAPSTSYGALQSIVLLNEPERWEINLQLILDLLFSDGFRRKRVELKASNKPHLPIIACGIDLLKTGFSNESSDDQFVTQEGGPPRIGHGAFLIALEQMFEKLSGRSLNYAALVGKPSPITYVFAEQVLREQARRNNASLRRIYAIGDNPHADVYGANLFNRLLALRRREREPQSETQPLDSEDQHLLSHVMEHSGMNLASMFDEEQSIKGSVLESESSAFASPSFVTASSSVHRARRGNEIEAFRLQFSGVATSRHAVGAASVRERERDSDPAGFSAPPLPPQPPQTSRSALEACVSVLVQTGITSEMGAATTSRFAAKDHFHRDLPRFRDCSTPAHVCANIDEALRTVFTAEQYEPSSSL